MRYLEGEDGNMRYLEGKLNDIWKGKIVTYEISGNFKISCEDGD